MTYRSIAASETDPQAPVTSALMKALADNPTAIAEGAAGAPKIALPASFNSGTGNIQFTGFGSYGGWAFHIHGWYGGGAPSNFTFSYSTNGGSTWSTAVNIASLNPSVNVMASGTFDFATGQLNIAGSQTGAGFNYSSAVPGASLAIDAVRFNMPGGGSSAYSIISLPNGGIL